MWDQNQEDQLGSYYRGLGKDDIGWTMMIVSDIEKIQGILEADHTGLADGLNVEGDKWSR